MAGGDEVDVVAAQLLQAEHLVGQLLGGDGPPMPLPTDVEVLAEHATEVALAEENRAGASPAPQAVFLAMMGKGTADHGQPPGAAVGPRTVVVAPVGMAPARADGAVGQGLDCLLSPVGKLTAFQQFQIAGPGGGHRTAPETFVLRRRAYSIIADSRSRASPPPAAPRLAKATAKGTMTVMQSVHRRRGTLGGVAVGQ